MKKRQTVKVTVFDRERYDGEWPPEEATEFLAWFDAKVKSIPGEYRAGAKVEISSVGSYEDSHYANIAIRYERPETDVEMKTREDAAKDRDRRLAERERAEFERLRKKFSV